MKKTNIIIIALLVLSLWMNYSNINRINSLNNNINNTYHTLRSEIQNINSQVSNTLESLRRESLWVRESSYQVKDFNKDLSQAEVEITFTLNEKSKEEKIYVTAVSQKNNKTYQFDVEESESLIYTLNFSLLADDNYDIQVLGESNQSLRSSPLETLNLSHYKKSLVTVNGELMGAQYSYEDEEGYFSFYVFVDVRRKSEEMFAEFLKDFTVKEVKADIYVGKEYIDTMDLLNRENYTHKELEDLSNAIPERESEERKRISESEHYSFSGIYEHKEEWEFPDIKLIVRVQDNKGNTYKAPIGHFTNEEYEEILGEEVD